MTNLVSKLIELKTAVINGKYSVKEAQISLSQLLLSSGYNEALSRKYDNELELIIYTLKAENQNNAVVKVIDSVIKGVDCNRRM